MGAHPIHTVNANGASIPAIGLGTWDLRDEECAQCVEFAIRTGYRHVDTAAMYENEEAVGEGMRSSGTPRDAIFLTTKVWPEDAAEGNFQRSVEKSLKRLDLDYADLVLLHWPNPGVPLAETMGALSDVQSRGLARHIGVSNFNTTLLREAVELCNEPLAVNQVEFHPYLDQSAVLRECRKHGMALTAYTPLAKGRVTKEPCIVEIAEAHGKSPAQVSLRWLVQQEGVIAIPKSSKQDRIREALDIGDFELSRNEMERISALAEDDSRLVNLAWAPDWD